jgi:maltose 6'-phosphate phosphatase
MKLLTLNCHAWLEEEQEDKIKILAQNIMDEKYDVIALQEVNQPIVGKTIQGNIKEGNFALVLLAALQQIGCDAYHMVWDYSHIGYDIYEEGLSLLTRHPMIETHSFFVSNSEDRDFWKTRRVLGITIKIKEEVVQLYSCHLGWWQDEEEPFRQQVDQLLHHVKKEGLTLLLGDFNNNAFVRGEGYDYLVEQGLYDTFTLAKEKDNGITVRGEIDGWQSNQGGLRLDLILANRKVVVPYSKVIFNGKNQGAVSDHYGVTVEICE